MSRSSNDRDEKREGKKSNMRMKGVGLLLLVLDGCNCSAEAMVDGRRDRWLDRYSWPKRCLFNDEN
jgi:hypothetical protein